MAFRVKFTGGLTIFLCSVAVQAKSDVLEIPINLASDNYAHVCVRVNGGKPLDFIFDTGASTCVLTERGKAKVGTLQFGGTQDTLGSGGVTHQPAASGVALALSGRTWKNRTLLFVDYHGSLHADGVIGYNLFSDKTIVLDYDRGFLDICDTPPVASKYLTPVTVTMKDELAFIAVAVSTGIATQKGLFAVDTGYGGTVTIASDFAQQAHLPGDLETEGNGTMAGTGSGVIKIAAVRLPGMSLGGEFTEGVPADIQLPGNNDFKTWNILGNEILKRFNLIWDIREKKMYFSRSRHFQEPYRVARGRRPLILALSSAAIIVIGGLLFARLKLRSR